MKLAALAVDYDGTIAVDGVFDPAVREAIGEARRQGVRVLLVTGRRVDDLRRIAGDLTAFDVIVAENGAVLDFPASGRHVVLGHPPQPAFVNELARRGVQATVGETILETDAGSAVPVLQALRQLEQPLILAFNRGRLMVLPQGMAKSTGLRQALNALRLSIHNVLGIGDAENDHDLLDACEVGAAVRWGSATLQAVADDVIEGSGPAAVADYIRRILRQPRLSATQMGRRRLMLGHEHDGRAVSLAVRGRTVMIAGEPGTGKSWLAGLICEQSILQGYCVCVIDPEGDYQSLEPLPGVITLGGDDPPPSARELIKAFRHPDVSLIVDLSRISQRRKVEYLETLLPLLATMRRRTGLPHKIVLDEAHYYLAKPDSSRLVDPELAGYIFVTYQISALAAPIRAGTDSVVIVTRETDPHEAETLLRMCRPCAGVSTAVFGDLAVNEAALLPGAEESQGRIRRFTLAPRLTSHVRHQAKYLDMPVSESQAFVFNGNGGSGPRARTLKEFVDLLTTLPDDRLQPHLKRHDLSRWLADVFRDHGLAVRVHRLEHEATAEDMEDAAAEIAQAIRARYDTRPAD